MKTVISILATIMITTLSTAAQDRIKIELNATADAVINTSKINPKNGKEVNSRIKKGANFTIHSVICDMSNKKGYNYIIGVCDDEGEDMAINLSKVPNLQAEISATNKDEYWYARTICKTLPKLSKMSNAYSFRKNAETSANKSISELKNNALVLDDPYLSSYIYSLLAKINPSMRLDFFNYDFRVIIVRNDEPNAAIYPNGALVINAGLLSRIHTEDELVALLCHEANHFLCNHYLDNIATMQKNAIGGMIAGVVVGIVSPRAGAAVASTIMNAASLGLAFDQTQEKESDQAAVDLLPVLGYDKNAMASLIKVIGDYYLNEGDLQAYYHSGKHPRIEDRIAATGTPYEKRDSTFEKRIASCVSYSAMGRFTNGRFSQALEMVNQNDFNGVASGLDYYVKGECILALYDSAETNNQARESFLKARELYPTDASILKSLIISDIRLGLKDEAKALLDEYISLARNDNKELTWAKYENEYSIILGFHLFYMDRPLYEI